MITLKFITESDSSIPDSAYDEYIKRDKKESEYNKTIKQYQKECDKISKLSIKDLLEYEILPKKEEFKEYDLKTLAEFNGIIKTNIEENIEDIIDNDEEYNVKDESQIYEYLHSKIIEREDIKKYFEENKIK